MPYWNLGNTFDYAEMSYLIFPRPFMVERGHHDGVGVDYWVAHEYFIKALWPAIWVFGVAVWALGASV